MKKIGLIIVFIFLLNPFYTSSVKATDAKGIDRVIYYESLNGTQIQLINYNTKLLLVDGFASWCGPCHIMMPELQKVYNLAHNQVKILSLGIDTVADNLTTIKNFKEKYNASWDFGFDYYNEFTTYFNVTYIPETFLFDASHNLLKHWIGITNSTEILAEMDKYIKLPGAFWRSNFWMNFTQFPLTKFVITHPYYSGFALIAIIIIFVAIFNIIKIRKLEKRAKE